MYFPSPEPSTWATPWQLAENPRSAKRVGKSTPGAYLAVIALKGAFVPNSARVSFQDFGLGMLMNLVGRVNADFTLSGIPPWDQATMTSDFTRTPWSRRGGSSA